MLFGHGDDAYMHDKIITANFSSNVVREGISQKMLSFLKDNIGCVANYPEVIAESLSKRIADYNSISPQNVIVTSGATSAFYLIAQFYKYRQSTIYTPSFSEYEDACRANNHEISFCERSKIKTLDCLLSEIIWICNPNNPDGEQINSGVLSAIISNNQDKIFVVDEAYIDFTWGGDSDSILQYFATLPNVIIVRSLTKNIAIPGLRLGYIMTSKEIADGIKKIMQPWLVNSLAISAGNFYFDNINEFKIDINTLLTDTQHFIDELRNTEICKVYDSNSTFFLAKLYRGNASSLKKYLVEQHGILIRDASNFHGLSSRHFRLSTQSPDQNSKLIEAIKQWNSTF